MASGKTFTAKTAENAKPKESPYRLNTGRGFYLIIFPDGRKYWRYDYTIGGKRKTGSLGIFPVVGLKEADERHLKHRKMIDSGIDPVSEKKRVKAQKQIEDVTNKATSFKSVAAEWFDTWQAGSAATTIKNKHRFIEPLLNALGDEQVNKVTPTAIGDIAKLIENDGKPEKARRVLMCASQIFDYAIRRGYCQFNPAYKQIEILKPHRATHHAAIIDETQLGQLLRDIEADNAGPSVKYCMRLLPYLPLRSTEIRLARWSEIDFENNIWTIPATRFENPLDGGGMKTREPFIVPLAIQTSNLLKNLQIYTGHGEICFPGGKKPDEPISGNALHNALKRMGYAGIQTPHGFRSCLSTLMREHMTQWGLDDVLVEMNLAHKVGGQVKAAYDRSQRLEDRRRAMQLWAD